MLTYDHLPRLVTRNPTISDEFGLSQNGLQTHQIFSSLLLWLKVKIGSQLQGVHLLGMKIVQILKDKQGRLENDAEKLGNPSKIYGKFSGFRNYRVIFPNQ